MRSAGRSFYRRESFWFWICMLVYVVAITQAVTAHDGFWPPAGVTIALLALALCTRFSVTWTGWVQLVLIFVLAFLLGGDVVGGMPSYLVLLAAACLGGAEFFALLRKKPSESRWDDADHDRGPVAHAESAVADVVD